MKIITGGAEYTVTERPSLGETTIRFPLETAPTAIGETVELVDNSGEQMHPPWVTTDFLRCFMEGTVLVLTQEPEAVPELPTREEQAAEIQRRRDALLAESDKYALLDAPIDAQTREAVYAYRQALRDVPEQAGFPEDVVWPEAPAVIKAAPDPVDVAFDEMLGGENHA